jgi:pSer/pThr/pTyr-binding forkhead associated (FHA) protein
MADSQTENLLPIELTIHDHYGRKTRIALHKLPAIIGRDEHADVPLIDPWTSHRHCEIDRIGDVLIVRDLDSKNVPVRKFD